jgi:hypothetical protein
MYDMLPFPNLNATSIEELSFQTNNYLIQFKETLEFILTNIGPDNLSSDLVEMLNSLGAEVEKTIEETDEQFQQVAGKTITVADVINSPAFKEAMEDATTPDKYLESVKEVDGGFIIYAVEDEKVKPYNINTVPVVDFSINFETGELEYTTS